MTSTTTCNYGRPVCSEMGNIMPCPVDIQGPNDNNYQWATSTCVVVTDSKITDPTNIIASTMLVSTSALVLFIGVIISIWTIKHFWG